MRKKIYVAVIFIVSVALNIYASRTDLSKRNRSKQEDLTEILSDNRNTAINEDDITNTNISTEKIIVETTTEMEDGVSQTNVSTRKYIIHNLNSILQTPELPTGCEITSLVMVLDYLGFKADKVTMAKDYLQTSVVGTKSPYVAFVGEPTDEYSYGCYAPVIVESANSYLSDQESSLKAYDMTGTSFTELLDEIDKNIPVIVWVTADLEEPHDSVEWTLDNGTFFTWKSPLHCVVLYGYDEGQGIVYVSDPLKGNVTYPLSLFQKRYRQMYSQAVVIK